MHKHRRSSFPLAILVVELLFPAWYLAGWAQSQAGVGQPLFRIADRQLSSPPTVISYGDMRFTDPKERQATNPIVRRWLVSRVAEEKPDVLLLGGDVPLRGGVANDYAVFDSETEPWRATHIFLSPALGNHELYGETQQQCVNDQQPCLENWWHAFPKLRGRRWYSAQIGSRMFVLNLDSNSSLLPGSEQAEWINEQLASLPPSVRFVFFNLHHPPVADLIPEISVNPARPNEVALAEFLRTASRGKGVRFIVVAAHIHNYERFQRDGIVYLVSGGGGAKPGVVRRGPDDFYQDSSFPNYHYVKFVLRENQIEAEMIRLSDPAATAAHWEIKDRFQVK